MKIQERNRRAEGETHSDAPSKKRPSRDQPGNSNHDHRPLDSLESSGVEIVRSGYFFCHQKILTAEVAELEQAIPSISLTLLEILCDICRQIFSAVLGRNPDQLHKSSHDPQNQSHDIEPSGVQPAVKNNSH